MLYQYDVESKMNKILHTFLFIIEKHCDTLRSQLNHAV